MGALLKEEFAVASEVLALDGIALWDFDYVDWDACAMPSFTVPVTIKSLVFSQDPRIPHKHHHHHHHAPSRVEGQHAHQHHHEGHHHHHHDTPEVLSHRVASRVRSRFDWSWVVIGACVAVAVYVAVIPLVFLLWQSFRTPQTASVAAIWTLGNYVAAYGTADTFRLFRTSIRFAFGASLSAFVVGTALAWMNERTNTPFKTVFFALSLIPLVIPSILFTVAWILLASPQIGIVNQLLQGWFGLEQPPFDIYSMAGMVWVDGLHYSPMAFLLMSAAFRAMDPRSRSPRR